MGQADSTRSTHAAAGGESVEGPVPPGPGDIAEKNWELAWIDLGGEG
jgi:hypothetical protein